MSKFNTKYEEERVFNHMGSKAFAQSPEMELVFASLTTFLEDSYYEKKDERVTRITKLIEKVPPQFVANLAVIARNEFHMRSISHLLIGHLAIIHKGDSLIKDAIVALAQRPDDLTEIASYVLSQGKHLPKQVKRGIRNAILKFDRYQLAKYRGEGKGVSLVDLFNLTHPKAQHATIEQKKAWKDLMEGKLTSFDTWETEISNAKNDAERKKAWESLVKSGKMGYMAMLRNLNNFIKYDVSNATIKTICKRLSDPEEVRKSKQLPFRFLSAFSAINGEYKRSALRFEDEADTTELFSKAISNALNASIENIPELPGRTVILTDNSGSMRGDGAGSSPVSAMSNTKTSDIANLFAVMYWMRANSTIVGVFGDRLDTPKLDRSLGIFDNYDIINSSGRTIGGGTEAGIFEMFNKLISEKKIVDRIIIFSDCQVGTGCNWYDHSGNHGDDFNALFQKYKKINPKVVVYSVDLKGYGNSMFKDDVFKIAGWSDRIFTLMENLEKGDGIVSYVNEYEFPRIVNKPQKKVAIKKTKKSKK